MTRVAEIVSSDLEDLILVDENDEKTGTLSKRECHLGNGLLHRAFSVFLFNDQGDVLLQQRSAQKMLWPLYWSNACCSHPRDGETSDEAAHRRIKQELGLEADLKFLYKFQYQANYQDVGSENELCWVWVGFIKDNHVTVNENEIANWRFVSQRELGEELKNNPDQYTPWMKMEWQQLVDRYQEEITP